MHRNDVAFLVIVIVMLFESNMAGPGINVAFNFFFLHLKKPDRIIGLLV